MISAGSYPQRQDAPVNREAGSTRLLALGAIAGVDLVLYQGVLRQGQEDCSLPGARMWLLRKQALWCLFRHMRMFVHSPEGLVP